MDTPRQDETRDTHAPRRQAREPCDDERHNASPQRDAAAGMSEDAIDEAVEMTFPASDPPAWMAP
ncbi:MAG TPA: hypothetical protein VFW98_11410 [Gemmatimonadaceae bacterium]|nr:hypothetical protein [Gemmatimonadaceae bacterium]